MAGPLQARSVAAHGENQTSTRSVVCRETAVILRRFFAQCPDLGGFVDNNVFDGLA